LDEKVTIQDIAERSGVSASTVSRALRDHPKITPETKRRVLEAAEELNYRSRLYPALTSGARLLAVILPSGESELLRHPFFTSILRGISLAAQSREYLVTYGYAATQPERLDILERYVGTPSVRGFVLLRAYKRDPSIDTLIRRGIPFAVIGRPEASQELLWVDNDNFHAAYDAVNHLIERGCRRIAFVGGPLSMNVTRDRLEGYRMALTNRGLTVQDELIDFSNTFGEAGGSDAMLRILSRSSPDALLASDDYLAIGALNAAREHSGMDLECVGFNNTQHGRDQYPSLSSVEIFPEQLGWHAASLVIDCVEETATEERHVVVPTRLVVRGASTRVTAPNQ
jgi:DNA-binding LacI/PurR family transcriptional regulator